MPNKSLESISNALTSEQVFLEFLNRCIDEICGRKGPAYEVFKSSANWSLEEFKEFTKSIKIFFYEAVTKHWHKDELLENLDDLESSRQQLVLECLKIRKDEINVALQRDTCAISGPVLEDFDWSLKWVMGSSKLSSLREPLLTVDFHTSQGREKPTSISSETKPKINTVSLELDKQELKTLVSALQKAQDVLTSWQS
uniref:COMM domain-containing protein n=1 Tax=Timema shepardi TaxID=629360 RepID=A0A7R9AUY7_TIMSH|nr:unnamed protein product [Timema shepardi]